MPARNRLRRYFDKITKSKLAKILISVIAFFTASIIPIYNFFFAAKHSPQLTDLRCEAVPENRAVMVARPLFFWQFQDEDGGSRQDSVYLKVGVSAGEASMWDYRFASSHNQARYAGKILENNRTYHWSVQVVDDDGLRSQVQHGTFQTAWQEQEIREIISIPDQEKMDNYILRHYLPSLAKLACAYRNANAGAACRYTLNFREAQTGVFALEVAMQSAVNAPALTFNDTISAPKAESALWELLERAHQKLKTQLENYHASTNGR